MSAIEEQVSASLSKERGLLRFITAGSVDDGKSTLIGRLLFDSKGIFADQLDAISRAKHKRTVGDTIDLSLLTDGLEAEREQGITIDVAYRYFATPKRKFIIADTPGHEQYTRNMVTGASTADVAVVLVNASLGVLTQTRRHAYLVSLMGIRHIALAINKMDLVNFDQMVFNDIVDTFHAFAKPLGFESVTAIPLSALRGDNMTERSAHTPWYGGPTMMGFLETVHVLPQVSNRLVFPVQWVNRPDSSFRGFCGNVAQGLVKVGDDI